MRMSDSGQQAHAEAGHVIVSRFTITVPADAQPSSFVPAADTVAVPPPHSSFPEHKRIKWTLTYRAEFHTIHRDHHAETFPYQREVTVCVA